MIVLYFYIFLSLFQNGYLSAVAEQKSFTKEFREAFSQKKYRKAIQLYEKYSQKNQIITPEIVHNAADAYFKLGDSTNAKIQYSSLTKNKNFAPNSLNQLGIIAINSKDTLAALSLFRQAILKDSENKIYSYNYELLKKQFIPKNKSQESIKLQKLKEIEQEEYLPQTQNELKEDELNEINELNLSKEQALQILNGLKERELDNKKFYIKETKKITDENW